MINNIFRASSRIFSNLNSPILSRNQNIVNKNYETNSVKICSFKNMASSSSVLDQASTSKPAYIHTNRLADEKSPYLLQHAHNPVDWYPWGDEAINKAKTENKMIFLSIGYSTCHWCHVMEHESFENVETAEIMNKNFVNIKVDREERPDIDKIYMSIVQMTSGSSGWPMSVWLTPNLTPITAGTYFPPNDKWGMPGFPTILNSIIKGWANNQDEIVSTGHQIIEQIKERLLAKPKYDSFVPGSVDAKVNQAMDIFKQKFDKQFGGFGKNPKFPEVSRLNILFHAYIMTKDEDVLAMALRTLEKIGAGGIHDHVFGGFARYSVDREWHIPHFEKMLYDQGQLMGSYANAYKLTLNEVFMNYADGIFRYIMKDLRHPAGGFYSGEDADSLPTAKDTKKIEGAFYAWTQKEIEDAFNGNSDKFPMDSKKAFEIYAHYYSIEKDGNVKPSSDPHGHLVDKNILIVKQPLIDTCQLFDITKEEAKSVLSAGNEILHILRDKRPRPHLDTKIITAWNGLILSGLARLAGCGGPKESIYMQAANDLLTFLKKYNYNAEKKTLLRSSYGTGTQDSGITEMITDPIEGFLDDYAFLIKGLLDYYKSSLDAKALEWAKELQDTQNELFWDDTNGGYFYSKENTTNVIIRLKEDHDGAEPCGNSVAARNLILLSYYYDLDDYKAKSDKLFAYFADSEPFGYIFPKMLSALILHEHGLDLVAVVGPDTENTKKFVEICRKYYIPGMIIVHIDPDNPSEIRKRAQEKFKMVKGQPTVYICHDKVCRMPVTDPNLLEQNLKTNYFAHNLKE